MKGRILIRKRIDYNMEEKEYGYYEFNFYK